MNSIIFLLRRDAITALCSRIRQPAAWAITLSILICSHLVVTNALASKHGKTDIDIVHPFSRALPPSSKNGAVYLQIINKVRSDRLLGASTPIAKLAEIHTHESEAGLMKMRKLDLVEIPKKKEISLTPGGMHIMLIDLVQPLIEGESFPLTLHFEKEGDVSITVPIMEPDAISAMGTSGHTHGKIENGSSQTDVVDLPIVRFELAILNGKAVQDNRTFRVTQDEIVEFYISSDESHILHLHGYDIEVKVDKKSAAVLRLDASATGRFPVEIHGAKTHHALFYIEVYPK